jgi:KaiC/GvpD/RAD55 family RecA-like ATPase
MQNSFRDSTCIMIMIEWVGFFYHQPPRAGTDLHSCLSWKVIGGTKTVDKLSTGVDSIDRRVNGGLNAGSMMAIISPPAFQIHTLIHQLILERPTVYITTLRSESSVQNDIDQNTVGNFPVAIKEVGVAQSEHSEAMRRFTDSNIYSINTTESESFLDDIFDIISTIGDEQNVIIDPVNPLERSESRNAYQKLLREFSSKLIDSEGLGVLNCLTLEEPPEFRETTLTFADVVWELDVVEGHQRDLEIRSRIPKNRGGDAVLEDITLKLANSRIHVDDSRNI